MKKIIVPEQFFKSHIIVWCLRLILCLSFIYPSAALTAKDNTAHSHHADNLPDLMPLRFSMLGFSIAPNFTVPGATVTASNILIRNNNDVGCNEFIVGIYVSSDNVYTIDDIWLKSIAVEEMDGNSNLVIEVGDLVVPSALNIGEYYLIAFIDYQNSITESNEENNLLLSTNKLNVIGPTDADIQYSKTFGLDGSPPYFFRGCSIFDYNIEEYGPLYIAPSGNIEFIFSIKNDGNQSVIPFSIGYYISNDPEIGINDYLIGQTYVQGLEANSPSMLIHESFDLPESLSANTYYFGVILDNTNHVIEAYGLDPENNNISTRSIVVLNVKDDNTPIWRARIRLKTADVDNARTYDNFDNTITARLGCSYTHLDYTREDFQRNSNDWYDLIIDDNFKYKDIHSLTIYKAGDDNWCLSEIELELNGATVFLHKYPNNIWLDGSNKADFSYYELRTNLLWNNVLSNYDIFVSYLTIEKEEISSLIQSIVGHESHQNEEFRWMEGKSVTLSRHTDNSILVELPLEAVINNWPDAAVDVTFMLNLSCDCDGIIIQPDNFNYSVSWLNELIASIADIEFPTADIAPQIIDVGLPHCPVILVTDNADIEMDFFTYQRNGSVGLTIPAASKPGSTIELHYYVENLGDVIQNDYSITTHLEDSNGNVILSLPYSTNNVVLDPCGIKNTKWTQEITLPSNLECNIKHKLEEKLRYNEFKVTKPKIDFFDKVYFPPAYYIVSKLNWYNDADVSNNSVKKRLNISMPDISLKADIKKTLSLNGVKMKVVYQVSNLGMFKSGNVKIGIETTRSGSIHENELLEEIVEIANLDGGAVVTGQFVLNQEQIQKLRTLGTFKIYAKLGDEVQECNYDNNRVILELPQ